MILTLFYENINTYLFGIIIYFVVDSVFGRGKKWIWYKNVILEIAKKKINDLFVTK